MEFQQTRQISLFVVKFAHYRTFLPSFVLFWEATSHFYQENLARGVSHNGGGIRAVSIMSWKLTIICAHSSLIHLVSIFTTSGFFISAHFLLKWICYSQLTHFLFNSVEIETILLHFNWIYSNQTISELVTHQGYVWKPDYHFATLSLTMDFMHIGFIGQ